MSLKTAPPNIPCWVLPFCAAAVVIWSEPWSASIWAPEGICCAPVSLTNAPDGSRMKTVPVTGWAVSVWPRTGGGGAGAAAVVNVWSTPKVVPALLVATSRTWYSAPGTSPESGAVTV